VRVSRWPTTAPRRVGPRTGALSCASPRRARPVCSPGGSTRSSDPTKPAASRGFCAFRAKLVTGCHACSATGYRQPSAGRKRPRRATRTAIRKSEGLLAWLTHVGQAAVPEASWHDYGGDRAGHFNDGGRSCRGAERCRKLDREHHRQRYGAGANRPQPSMWLAVHTCRISRRGSVTLMSGRRSTSAKPALRGSGSCQGPGPGRLRCSCTGGQRQASVATAMPGRESVAGRRCLALDRSPRLGTYRSGKHDRVIDLAQPTC
jgi:hypothetical protein